MAENLRQMFKGIWKKNLINHSIPFTSNAFLDQIQKPSLRKALENGDDNVFINPQVMSG